MVTAVLFLLVILTLTTTSWIEPLVVLIGLGAAILINSGSNLIFGEISLVTNAAGNILQLAVSLDYSVFLFMPSFRGLGKVIRKVMYPIGIIFVCLIIPAYVGSNSNSYYYGSSHIFGSETRLSGKNQGNCTAVLPG